jgi:hypothetical protein
LVFVATSVKEIMIDNAFQNCIDACFDSALACDTCAAHCLRENDVKMLSKCISLDIECAAVCRLAVQLMGSSSDYASAICQVCADICHACAMECRLHNMEHCQDCALACERCMEECASMAAA